MDLRVRYSYGDATPITHTALDVIMRGALGDAQIAARTIHTNGSGEATVRVTSGTVNAAFQVVVNPPAGNGATFLVAVSDSGAGSISVELNYGGAQRFDVYMPFLFVGESCMLNPESLPVPALQIAAPVTSRFGRGGFLQVMPGTNYTVVVVAELGGAAAGFGCSLGIAVTPRTETLVRVTVEDWAPP